MILGLFLAAYARPPDLQVETDDQNFLSGRLDPAGPDAIYWNEGPMGPLYVTEVVEGELTTRLLGEGVDSVVALVDYDGDNWRDVALIMEWQDEDNHPRQALAIWLHLSPEEPDPLTTDDSHCLPPPYDWPELPTEPVGDPAPRSCGCSCRP